MNMSEPSQAALAAKGGHAGDISLLVIWSCHLTPRMRLRHRKWKEFKRRSVSFRWSKFTVAEQGAENAYMPGRYRYTFWCSQSGISFSRLSFFNLDMVPVLY